MMFTGTIKKISSELSTTLKTTVSVSIGETTRFNENAEKYTKEQIIETTFEGIRANSINELQLMPGQLVQMQLDFKPIEGRTEVEIIFIYPYNPIEGQ